MLKSIVHNGQDVADSSVELANGDQWTDVEVKVTKRRGTISGDIVDDQNAPVLAGTVIIFATESQKWFESSRYVRAARPNQQGQWRIAGLPEGDYLAAAVDYVENGEWNDPEYLASLREVATRITLPDGGSPTMHLKIVTPKQ